MSALDYYFVTFSEREHPYSFSVIIRPTGAMLTRALPPVSRFPATSSDDISGGRVMTVLVAIQDQRSVFLVHICAGQSCRGGGKKLQEDILYGFMQYEAPGGGARRCRAIKVRCYTACGGLVRLDGVLDGGMAA